jgi:excisionase family DNA binding protein
MKKKTYYTIAQAAEFLGVHPETLRRWDRSKKLEAEKINKRGDRRYDLELLTRFKEMIRLETEDKNEALERIDQSLTKLEGVAETAKYDHALGDHFREARDLSTYILEDEEKAQQFQTLISLFSFQVEDDEFKPKMSGTDEKGNFWQFPNFNDFTDKDIFYLASLLDIFCHPRIRSRIAHFLWVTKRDYKAAQVAVDEYLELSKWLSARIRENPEDLTGLNIERILKNAYDLAKKVNYKVPDVSKEIAHTILNFDNTNASRWAVTIRLLRFCLDHKDEYQEDFWANAVKICRKMAQEQEEKNNLDFARKFLSLGEKIEKIIFDIENTTWRQRIALTFELDAQKHKNSFVESDYLIKAITQYKQLGYTKKATKLESQLAEAKKNMKFETFSQTIDLTDFITEIRRRFKAIVQKESKELLLIRLTSDRSILPKMEKVKEHAEDTEGHAVFRSLFSTVIIDEAGNMPRKYETEEEKQYFTLMEQYQFSLMTTDPLLRVLFEELIEAEKIDVDSVLKHMTEHLWYGKEYDMRNAETGQVIEKRRKWVSSLLPGITAYINCLKCIKAGNEEEARDYLVLAVDTLTPKIEGLIREFYEKIGRPIDRIKTERGKAGKQVTERKDINELLRDPEAEAIFGEDLLFLMKYVLIEVAGINLRNKVAHSLIFRENYRLFYAHMVFLIILRIGAYEFNSIQPKDNTEV